MNFKSKKFKIVSSCVCIVALLTVVAILVASMYIPATIKGSLFSKSALAATVNGSLKDDARAPEGMKLVCENAILALFYDETESQMAVFDKANGKYWHANPEHPENDSSATGFLGGKLRSAITISYYNAADLRGKLNTYQSCVSQGTLKYEFIENGIRLIYQLGDDKITRDMLPSIVDKEKFESKILSKLSGQDKDNVEKYYKLQKLSEITNPAMLKQYNEGYSSISENKEYYYLNLYTPEFKLDGLYEAIYNVAGYTVDDAIADNEEVGSKTPLASFINFVIPVEYTLVDDAFRVNIPTQEIVVPGGLYLTELELLPFFGASEPGEKQNGYIVTPDGSGSIVELNSSKVTTYDYNIPIYGNDFAYKKEEETFNSAYANMPIFGIVHKNDKAMLAVIEEGESHARVNVNMTGKEFNTTSVGAIFALHPMDVEVITETKFNVSTNLYQESAYKGNITMSYRFLGEDRADYSSLAVVYREYLKKENLLQGGKDNFNFNLKLTANVMTDTSFMGIPYSKVTSVTTIKEATEIIKALKEKNVDDLTVGYASWFGGGIAQNAITGNNSISSNLGTKGSLKKLLSEIEGSGDLALGTSVIKVYKGLPQFNYFTYAVRMLNKEVASGHIFHPATFQPDKREDSFYYLSSRYLNGALQNYEKSVNKLNVSALWLDDVASILASDFADGSTLDREISKQLIIEALANVEDNKLTLSNPNAYAFKYLSNAVNIPSKSSENTIVEKSIPFMQIVLSGNVNYSSDAFNRSGNDNENFLKAVETGSDLYYEWIHSSDLEISKLDGVETEKLYSMGYENWIDIASKQYNRIKTELADIEGKEIIFHDTIADKVVKTCYENAYVVVNYNYEDVTVDGTVIPARDFVLVKEG